MVTETLIKRDATTAHPGVDIKPGMSAEEYVGATLKMHQAENPKGFANGGLLKFSRWMGDAGLAVVPKNRLYCSIGLTAGGGTGLYLSRILTGRNLSNNAPMLKEEVPKLLRPLHNVLPFDPASSTLKNRWSRIGALFVFTAASFVGIMVGAKQAYKSAYKANENPDSLEDFTARIGQHQGDKWRWLAASSGVFGSTAGYFALPFVPGVNYGSSIAFYTVLNQDRKIMTPGLRSATGTKTTSYLGLREGLEYITKYAVHNPSKDPAELEYLALTVLGPLAHAADMKLTADHIKGFVDKIHSVRDKYWQEGGIPKERKVDLKLELDDVLKNKGLDKTLYEIGFDTTKIDFTKLNGLVGKLGNSMGAKTKILKDQEAYRTMVAGWRSEWQQPEKTVQVQDEKGLGQDTDVTRRYSDTVKPKSRASTYTPDLTYQERLSLDAANARKSQVRAE